jgi:hypothetical protein
MFGGVTIHLAGLPIQDDLVLELAPNTSSAASSSRPSCAEQADAR